MSKFYESKVKKKKENCVDLISTIAKKAFLVFGMDRITT